MSNVVSTMIFCARNVDKAENQGKIGRWPVAIAQANNVFQAVKKLDGKLGETAKSASEILKAGAKKEKILDGLSIGVNTLSKYVNPLICISAGIDVLNSDNKEAAIVTNTTALTSMFAVEKLMKKHLTDESVKEVMENVTGFVKENKLSKGLTSKATKIIEGNKNTKKFAEKAIQFAQKHNVKGKIPKIISGVAFVAGSIMAYDCGEKFGNLLLRKSENKTQEPA